MDDESFLKNAANADEASVCRCDKTVWVIAVEKFWLPCPRKAHDQKWKQCWWFSVVISALIIINSF
jgi:hypothetical protein